MTIHEIKYFKIMEGIWGVKAIENYTDFIARYIQ
jgi:hypothetical protein